MRKRISLVTIGLLLVLLIATMAAACNKGTENEQVFGKGLNVSFLKDFTIDLDGVTSLAIEKRATAKPAVANVAYADEVSEKNKLVGETEDKTVVEITLRTKMGETFSQDDLEAEFNKLYVSGNFVYFELRPIDLLESLGENGQYYYYDAADLNEDGTPKEGAILQSTHIYQRENFTGEALETFEKSSTPNPITGSFVYSIESDKIYDLSETGYEVMGKDVVKIGGNVCRANINENGEFETTALFNAYTASKIEECRVDRWGNVFGKSNTDNLSYADTDARVFVESRNDISVCYVSDESGNSAQINRDGTVKWITENGELRDPQPGDNFVQRKIASGWGFWEGITNGVAFYYPAYPPVLNGMGIGSPGEGFMLTPQIAIIYVTEVNGNSEDGPYAVWYDITDPNVQVVEDGKVTGLNVITDNFTETYPNAQQNIHGDNPDAFVVSNQNGETTYEFYWDDAEQTVKIRVQEEIIAPPKEIKKFQPIGG